MSYSSAIDSATGLKRGSSVTSRTRSPSIHISRSSRSESRYCWPVRIMLVLSNVFCLVRDAEFHDSVSHHPKRIIKFAFHTRARRQGGAHRHPLHHFH